ncbi:MAG TPA: DUF3623 domain-containing protein [Kiloniellaceae bacterium]|nr:DUF3623 domain-containing protein [Kiloniellaceae bacterium]
MATYVLPALAALLVWWLSTGVILMLQRLPERTYGWSFLGTSLLAAIALCVLILTAGQTTMAGAYWAFLSGVALWGWHELTFLQGRITGPHKGACPLEASVSQRFVLAVRTLLYHELAILATLGLLAAVTWNQPNKFGLWVFLVLFAMRLSTKLNIFLGVPHLSEELLPQRLAFLKSYFGRRPMNSLFPVSITLSTLLAAYVFHAAFSADADAFAAAGYTLVGAMVVLGTLEHWLLVLPLQDSALWRWALGRDETIHNDKTKTAVSPISAVPSEGRFP